MRTALAAVLAALVLAPTALANRGAEDVRFTTYNASLRRSFA